MIKKSFITCLIVISLSYSIAEAQDSKGGTCGVHNTCIKINDEGKVSIQKDDQKYRYSPDKGIEIHQGLPDSQSVKIKISF